MIGNTTIGANAAPTPQEVTGQNEFGKCSSEMLNRSLISIDAAVMEVAFRLTIKVLSYHIS